MGRELGVEDGPGLGGGARGVEQDVAFVLTEPCTAEKADGGFGLPALGAREAISDLLER
jgi:hypothetical protein